MELSENSPLSALTSASCSHSESVGSTKKLAVNEIYLSEG